MNPDLLNAIRRRSLKELNRDVVPRWKPDTGNLEQVSRSDREPASSKEKHHPSASPQGEVLKKDILSAEDHLLLERLGRFPQETIDERCTGMRLDRMDEWRIRKHLTHVGYVRLAGKMGKVEFWGVTEKGKYLVEQRGVQLGTWKSGLLHEVIVRRVEEDLQRQHPEMKAQRGGQCDGVQPDLTITGMSGGCAAVQVSVTNSSSNEAACAWRLAMLHAFTRVVMIVTSHRKLLEMGKALARIGPGHGLFADGKAAPVDVLHAVDVLQGQVDWLRLAGFPEGSKGRVSDQETPAEGEPARTPAMVSDLCPAGEAGERSEPDILRTASRQDEPPGQPGTAVEGRGGFGGVEKPGEGLERLEAAQDGVGAAETGLGLQKAWKGLTGLQSEGAGLDRTRSPEARAAGQGMPEGAEDGNAGRDPDQEAEPEVKTKAKARKAERSEAELRAGERAEREARSLRNDEAGSEASGEETKKATEKGDSSVEEGQRGADGKGAGAIDDGSYLPQERDYPRQGRGRRNPRAARDVDDAAQRRVKDAGRGRTRGVGSVGDADQNGVDLNGVANGDDNVRTTVVVKGGACHGGREKKEKQGRRLNLKHEVHAGDRMLLTLQEAADLCSVSRKSITRAVRAGNLRTLQAPGTIGLRGRRVLHSDLLAWLQWQVQDQHEARARIRRTPGPSGGRLG